MKYLIVILFLIGQFNFSFCQEESLNYSFLVDSAFTCIKDSHEKSSSFLDAIPEPKLDYIENKGKFYYLKALLSKGKAELIRAHESFILSINYAQGENDFKTAGDASHELALSLYSINEDKQAGFYINQAKEFYTKIGDNEGFLNVLQIPAYRKYLSHNYEECINLTLEHLDAYKLYSKDQYYNLLANSMLVSSYIGLNNLDSANKYYTQYKQLKDNPTIYSYDYQYFNDFLYIDYINYFFRHDEIDSCLLYLSIVEKNIPILDEVAIEEIYLFYIDVYKKTKNKNKENAYIDSLSIFKKKVLQKNIQGSFEIHKSLIESDKKIKTLKSDSNKSKIIALILIFVIIILLVFYYFYRKKIKSDFNALKDDLTVVSFIDSNHEKLKIKTKNLEEYVLELRKILKSITQESDKVEQQNKIDKLYKDLHLRTVNSEGVGGSHSELVNKLNAKFFIEVQSLHPELNDSEIVICYYISVGFKNKEIATFLNSSIRSLESKRFRISKKINLAQNENLADYLSSIYRSIS